MPMFSRKTNDPLSPPAFLRRSPDDQHATPSLMQRIQDKLADYRYKQRCKLERAEIQKLMAYLHHLKDHPDQIDYQLLEQLKAPNELIAWLRLAVLKDDLIAVVRQNLELAKEAASWSEFQHKICFAIFSMSIN